MKLSNIFKTIALCSAPLFLFTSCEKEKIAMSFGGEMEHYDVYEEGNKTYYAHHEQYAYWEQKDSVAFVSDADQEAILGKPSDYDCPTTTFRDLEFPANTKEVLAIYPYSSYVNWDGDDNLVINFPGKMNYSLDRSTTGDPNIDSTFAKNSLPYIAWNEKADKVTNLYFRAVAGIARIQLFSSNATQVTIDSIVFTGFKDATFAQPIVISGQMQVSLFNKEPYYSYVTLPSTAVADGNDRITLTNVKRSLGGSSVATTDLLTFYVPFPATGTNNLQRYYINMKVSGKDASNNVKTFNKRFKIDIHRQNITMMPAVDIDSWTTSTGASNVHIVGSGTKDRPFQIYSGAELVAVRNAYNNGETINGQALTKDTYYKVTRSDIYLKNPPSSKGNGTDADSSSAVWTTGFGTSTRPFVGHFYISSANAVYHHITNNSSAPLFNYIGADGEVDMVTVNGNIVYDGTDAFSPLCIENHGTMTNCHNRCTVTSTAANIAGLCVTNYGAILDGASESSLTATGKSVAGICLTNETTGEIRGFQLSSAMPVGGQVAGICHNNKGKVYDCMVTINQAINVTSNWGGIVYTNSGTVEDCMISGPQMVTTNGSIGGICNTLTGGTINYCWNTVAFITSSASVAGGVVASASGGTIKNCWSASGKQVAGNTYAGGICGVLNGSSASIVNCYNRSAISGVGYKGGIVGNLQGGSVANCYNDYSSFYGIKLNTIVLGSNCYNEDLYQQGTVDFPPDYQTMSAALNTYASSNNCFEWLCSSATTLPTLKRPTASKGRR